MSKFTAIFIGLLAAVLIMIGISFMRPSSASNLIEMSFNPSFALTDHNGRKVTEKDFADKYVLSYFGFTSCPDICPVDLQRLADAYAGLPQDKKDKLQVLFFTVDPARDTPKAIKEYLANFNDDFLGLTGDQKSIDTIKKNYKMYAERAESTDHSGGHGEHAAHGQKNTNYTFNHTAMFYIAAPQNKPMGVLKNDLETAVLTRNLTAIIP